MSDSSHAMESRLPVLAQLAQQALLSTLQEPGAPVQMDALGLLSASEFLDILQRLAAATPAISAEEVPDPRVREGLELLLSQNAARETVLRLEPGEIDFARETIEKLRQGVVPSEDALIAAIRFFQSAVKHQEIRREPIKLGEVINA